VKRAKPNIIERLKDKAAAAAGPQVQAVDIQNVMVAARLALPQLRGVDLINVSTSLANLEAAFAPKAPAAQPPAAPAAGEKPAEDKKD